MILLETLNKIIYLQNENESFLFISEIFFILFDPLMIISCETRWSKLVRRNIDYKIWKNINFALSQPTDEFFKLSLHNANSQLDQLNELLNYELSSVISLQQISGKNAESKSHEKFLKKSVIRSPTIYV